MAAVLTARGLVGADHEVRALGLCSPTSQVSISPKALGPLSAAALNDLPQRTTGEYWGGEGFEVTFAGSSFVRAPGPREEGSQKVWLLTWYFQSS